MDAPLQRAPEEKIGVIFVHGIGEQGAFEHLQSGAVEMVLALKAKERGKRITVSVNTTADATYKAGQQTWRAEDRAPVWIDVTNTATGSFKRIELREVWWADLDEEAGIGSLLRFLWWGCTLWARPTYKTADLESFKEKLFTPRRKHACIPRRRTSPNDDVAENDPPPIPGEWDRAQLFFCAVLFLLVLPTWSLAGLVLRSLRLPTLPSAKILIDYIGDVKLYGQQHRHDTWPLSDLRTPPRFMIRRRFMQAMIDTALGGYSRWYVLGHSLGSVVALNGLMEPGQTLPNYLNEERWRKCCSKGLSHLLPAQSVTSVRNMIPSRPAWLEKSDAIDRRKLFKAFRGLLTYGSPLDKFAVLFTATVPLNRDQAVFPDSAEWINVYEPTDPVAGALDLFGPFTDPVQPDPGKRALFPENYSVRCWPILMWSHLKYFNAPAKNRFADAVQKWLIYGWTFERAFLLAQAQNYMGRDTFRRWSKLPQALVFFLVTLLLFTWLLSWLLPRISTAWQAFQSWAAGFTDPNGRLAVFAKGLTAPFRWMYGLFMELRNWADAQIGLPDFVFAAGWNLAVIMAVVAVLGVIAALTVNPGLPPRK